MFPSEISFKRHRAILAIVATVASIGVLSTMESSAYFFADDEQALSSDIMDRRQLRQTHANYMPVKEVIRYDRKHRAAISENDNGKEDGIVAPPWYQDIDYKQSGLCGAAKCFFLSVTNPSNGYLIWDSGWNNKASQELTKAMEAYNYASDLKQEFGIRHFYSSQPTEIPTPEHFLKHLFGRYTPYFENAKTILVQPMRSAPEGSIIVRCNDDRALFGRLQFILNNMEQDNKRNLLGELERAITMVEAKPELITDFQLMIDEEGKTYHLDLDRAFVGGVKGAGRFEGCLEGAVEFVQMHMIAQRTTFSLDGGHATLTMRKPEPVPEASE